MNEMLQIIDGYNKEKVVLVERLFTKENMENYKYENTQLFASDVKKRIKEIDQIIEGLRKSLFIKEKDFK